jgi:cell wall assembly regulator SMI1
VIDNARRNLLLGGTVAGALALAGVLPGTCAKHGPRKIAMTDDPPNRPPGEPKPLLDEDIAPVLARLDAWFDGHLPPDRYVFNPPATETELTAFERRVGIKLPRAYHQLYRWHDGEDDDRSGHIYGLPILPLDEAGSQWQAWVDVLAGSGNHIGLDFDPWPGGRVGQVILFGRDEEVKAVLAESLGKFLDWIVGLLESGNFRLGLAPGERVLREFRLKDPPSNDFHDGARILLGAPGPFG